MQGATIVPIYLTSTSPKQNCFSCCKVECNCRFTVKGVISIYMFVNAVNNVCFHFMLAEVVVLFLVLRRPICRLEIIGVGVEIYAIP